MKRMVSLLLILALLAVGLVSAPAEEAQKDEPLFLMREYPVFLTNLDTTTSREWPLFFTDDAEDMPWIDLEELAHVANMVMNDCYENKEFHLEYIREGSIIRLERETTGMDMVLDFDANTITFGDYNVFMQRSDRNSLMDLLSYSGFNSEGDAELFQREPNASFVRFGDYTVLKLSDYNIFMEMEGDRGYIPLQTANDILLAPLLGRSLMFNGQVIVLASQDDLYDNVRDGLTELGSLYYSAEPVQRSQALAEYSYNELCLALDINYGLKKTHGIDSFDRLFWQMGFQEELSSTDPKEADLALKIFISSFLDDLHSSYSMPSWMTGLNAYYEFPGVVRPSDTLFENWADRYKQARSNALGKQVPAYQEVGNTAYVTFDGFVAKYRASAFYSVDLEELMDDTIALIIYAHRQINRENSPVENVVIDLSNNTGGDADAALFVIAWILGEAEVSQEDSFTGAQATLVYRADVNLDRQFDQQDTLQGKRVFCLISPVSFSCGNLVPAVFKANQGVTLIGRTSGGGSCVVRSMTTAWGTFFTISGNSRLSFRKNGSLYDIDEGVDPDVYLSRIENFYDREKLTDLINGLP